MSKKGKKAIEVVTSLVRSVKAPYADWREDSVVPDWDRVPGIAQHASRVSRGQPPKADGTCNNPQVKSNHPKI